MCKMREILQPPTRLYAIGDIHGCVDELQTLLDYLETKERLTKDDLIIFIGDYIDRGDDSRGVVELLIQYKKKRPSSIFLKGNHEDMLLNFLGFNGRLGDSYLMNGGREFLESYDLAPYVAPEAVLHSLPPEHVEFYQSLESYVAVGKYVFVHAGLHPLRPLEDQFEEDLFWIRDEFIMNVHKFDRTVVFGHTPYQDIFIHPPYKIGIDTGLVYGNKLTCIDLTQHRAIQVGRGSLEVVNSKFSESLGL